MIEEVINSNEFKDNNSILEKEYSKVYKKLSMKYEGYELDNKVTLKLVNKGFKYDEVRECINLHK